MKKFIAILFIFTACNPALHSNKDSQKVAINQFLDQWHQAAAEANADIFFGSIAEDGIYIGTDASERWKKEEFWEFSKPYFDRGKAWDFTPYDRQIFVSADGNMAWFSESLKTWMGICRGSGVLQKTKTGWEIKQYHLSVTVPNDAIQEFLQLIDNYNKNK